ncbi:YesL family protein [Salipaludibacillus sp. HK11]|uniref:YesL family protein n=1 Tax=Salipaludibacillus sp. HK11 TaxID=3394320 RepID=UPI0039FD2B64
MNMAKSMTDTPLYALADWVMKLAYINLLWFLFTFLGLIILGFMPSTVAMFTVVRKLLLKDDIPIFKTFYRAFKKEFLKSNLLGFVLGVVGFILYIDYLYLGTTDGYIHSALSVGLILISICYIAITLIILPIYVHYDLKFIHYFKHAFFIALISPHIIIFLAVGIVGIYYVFNFLPGLTMFFLGSGVATFSMWCTLMALHRIEKKKETLETT